MRHTSDIIKIDHVALAILRCEDQIVMVQQHIAGANEPYWVLPGGLVEGGELITDALIREVKEETGVQVNAIGPLVGISQIDRPLQASQTLLFVFEIAQWQGTLQSQDPDGEVLNVELVKQRQVIHRLQRKGAWPGIQQPLLAYLRDKVHPGTMWFYREGHDGQVFLAMLPSAPSDELNTAPLRLPARSR